MKPENQIFFKEVDGTGKFEVGEILVDVEDDFVRDGEVDNSSVNIAGIYGRCSKIGQSSWEGFGLGSEIEGSTDLIFV